MRLVRHIEKQCNGGMSLSISEIKEMINKEIKNKYARHRKLHLLPDLHESMLNYYTSIIKRQKIFNLYSKVGNKSKTANGVFGQLSVILWL